MKIHWFVWVPRFLLFVFSALMMLFYLDVLSGSEPFIFRVETFMLQCIPAVVLLLILWLAWGKPMLSGVLLILVSFIFTFYYQTYKHMIIFVLISGAPFLIGFMFIVVHFMHPKKKNEIDPTANLKIQS